MLFPRPNKSWTNEHTKRVVGLMWRFFFSPASSISIILLPRPPPKKVELFGVLTHELSHYQALGFQRHILGPPLTSRWLCAWNQANRSLPRVREEKQKCYNSHIIFTTVIFWRVLWICNYEEVVYIPKSPLLQDNMVMLLKNVSCWEQRQWGVEHFSTVCAYNNFFLLNNKKQNNSFIFRGGQGHNESGDDPGNAGCKARKRQGLKNSMRHCVWGEKVLSAGFRAKKWWVLMNSVCTENILKENINIYFTKMATHCVYLDDFLTLTWLRLINAV